MVNREQRAQQLLHRLYVVCLSFVADGQLLHFLSFCFHHYFMKKKSENKFKRINFHMNLISQRKRFQKYSCRLIFADCQFSVSRTVKRVLKNCI